MEISHAPKRRRRQQLWEEILDHVRDSYLPIGALSPGDGSCERAGLSPCHPQSQRGKLTSCQSAVETGPPGPPTSQAPCPGPAASLHPFHFTLPRLLSIPSLLPAPPSCRAISQPATMLPSGVFQWPSSEPSASRWKCECGPSAGKGLPFL